MQQNSLDKSKSPNDLEILKASFRQIYKESLFKTAKFLCGYKDVNHHTHDHMINALEALTPKKLLIMPRGTFKSSIGVVAYTIWRLIRDPNERILIDSEVYGNSKNFLREIKGIITSEFFRTIFGDWDSNNWNEGEITIAPRNKIFKEASVTCGGIGTTKVGQHYTIIIGDDYNSGNNSGTPEARQKIISHYKLNLAILEPNGTYVVIGTRYSVDDLAGFILENELGMNPNGIRDE